MQELGRTKLTGIQRSVQLLRLQDQCGIGAGRASTMETREKLHFLLLSSREELRMGQSREALKVTASTQGVLVKKSQFTAFTEL